MNIYIRYPETNITPAKKPKANRKFMSETRCSSCHMTTGTWNGYQNTSGSTDVWELPRSKSLQCPTSQRWCSNFHLDGPTVSSKTTPWENSRFSWNVRMMFLPFQGWVTFFRFSPGIENHPGIFVKDARDWQTSMASLNQPTNPLHPNQPPRFPPSEIRSTNSRPDYIRETNGVDKPETEGRLFLGSWE